MVTELETTESEENEPQVTEQEVVEAQTTELEVTEETSGSHESNEADPTDPVTIETDTTEPTIGDSADGEDQESAENSDQELPGKLDESSGDSEETIAQDSNEDVSDLPEDATGEDASGEGQGSEVNNVETGEDDFKSDEDTVVPSDPVEIEVVADERVDADSRLTVQIVPPSDVEKLQLGLGNAISVIESAEETTETGLGDFPRFLCYSDNGGEHYYMLYNAGLIEVEVSPEGALPLLLDFSRTEIEEEELVIAVAGLQGEFLVGSGSAVVSIKPQERAELSSCLLSEQQSIRINIPESWNEYTGEVVIEMLTCDWNEDGTACEMAYDLVDPEEIGIELEEDTNALILRIDDVLPPAGTYRISIQWTYEEECVAEMQENFFVNYLAYHKVVETGGAEQ